MARLWLLATVYMLICIVARVASPWTDLMRVWNPNASSSIYRFGLPGPDHLVVTLVKHSGGSRNRVWEVQIQHGFPSGNPLLRLDDFSEFDDYPGKKPQGCLSRRTFVGSNEGLWDPFPGLWVRPVGNSWRFLSYQDIDAPRACPIEVPPRQNFQPGERVEFGEGYFVWQPGMRDWVASNYQGQVFTSPSPSVTPP